MSSFISSCSVSSSHVEEALKIAYAVVTRKKVVFLEEPKRECENCTEEPKRECENCGHELSIYNKKALCNVCLNKQMEKIFYVE